MLNLEVMSGKQTGRELRVKKVEFLVGSADGCDLKLASKEVGAHHCRIIQNERETVLRDLDGPGTFVNGMRVSGALPLQEGDMVEIGPMRFKIKFDSDPIPGTAAYAAAHGLPAPKSRVKDSAAKNTGAESAPAASPASAGASSIDAPPADSSMLEAEINAWLHDDAAGLAASTNGASKGEMAQVYAELSNEKDLSQLNRELGITPVAQSASATKSSAAEALEAMSGKKKPAALKDKQKGNFIELAQVLQGAISHYAQTKTGVTDLEILRALVLVQKAHGEKDADSVKMMTVGREIPRVL